MTLNKSYTTDVIMDKFCVEQNKTDVDLTSLEDNIILIDTWLLFGQDQW